MYEKKEIEFLVEIIKSKLEDNLDKIILFGSYAQNKANPDSDIDVAIILNSIIDRKSKLELLNSLWWEASKNGISADFIIKPLSVFNDEKVLPTLSKVINNEGSILWQRV